MEKDGGVLLFDNVAIDLFGWMMLVFLYVFFGYDLGMNAM